MLKVFIKRRISRNIEPASADPLTYTGVASFFCSKKKF
jgi:hypothetical protein